MRVIATRQHSPEYDAPDPEGEESLMRMVYRARLLAAAHDGMRVRLASGKIIEPTHRPDRCPYCVAPKVSRAKHEQAVAALLWDALPDAE